MFFKKRSPTRKAPKPAARAPLALAATLGMLALLASSASPASAASRIQQSTNYTCGNALIAVNPPRVWTPHGQPERAIWLIQIDRWNGSSWYRYSQFSYIATFNYYGQSPTSWSMHANTRGGRYINSRMQIPVGHRGYYRVASAVAAPRLSSAVYVGGENNNCFMP